MGKQSGKKKKLVVGGNSGDSYGKPQKVGESSPRAYDKDMAVFIAMSQELKEEGNRLFQKRDYEGAMSKYERALKLLPRVHIDVSYLRSNMAACYMQMGLSEYPRAINECNLALELTPKYSKALLKRARCYEALNRLDLALRDVTAVLNIEPNNVMALEIADRVKATIAEKGLTVNNGVIELPPDYVEPPSPSSLAKRVKEKARKKKSNRTEAKKPVEDSKEAYNAGKPKENISEQVFDRSKAEEGTEEKKPEDKAVVEERITSIKEEVPTRAVKLILGEDIRWAQVPYNCSLLQVREVVQDRFPGSGSVLVKYRDQEGDLVTITTDEELRWAEASAEAQGSLRLYVVQVNPDQDPFLGKLADSEDADGVMVKQKSAVPENGHEVKANGAALQSTCIDDWIIHFAQLFKNHVGLDSDEYLDLHELGMKLYAEAMEETITSDEAQNIFSIAAEKFQEMAALALFNWGNVHMSRARKGVHLTEDAPEGSVLEQIKNAYDQALKEYKTAGRRYEEALKIKPDFYEGHLAVGQQQFEQAKLSFYYELSCKSDVKSFPYSEILQLYNYAEDNMEKGMQMWEEWEEQRDKDLKKSSTKVQLQQLGLDRSYNDITANEAAEQAAAMRSQINLLWGSMLYERSITEFKLGLPVWHESLEVAVEKFELAGASPTDIAVMVKNHCSNDSAIKGLEFKIDEIVQAWNEIYEAKKWQSSVPSFRLEPLFRRRTSRLHHVLEHP